jgi:hypothetical protein
MNLLMPLRVKPRNGAAAYAKGPRIRGPFAYSLTHPDALSRALDSDVAFHQLCSDMKMTLKTT